MAVKTDRGAPERNGKANGSAEGPPPGDGWAAPTSGRQGRSLRSRAPVGVLAAVVAALLAFVLVIAAAGDRSAKVEVAVASHDVAAGAAVTPGDVAWVGLPAKSELAGRLVGRSDFGSRRWVAGARLPAGAPIGRAALVEGVASGGRRAMSIPVAPERAAGGGFQRGDRVDVIDVTGTDAAYVVADAEVLEVASGGSSSIGASRADFYVVVAVDGAEALRLAAALADGKIDVVRSTGAVPLPAGTVRTRVGGGGG